MSCNWILILSLFVVIKGIANPGILITIPFPIQPPLLTLNLPFPIDNFVINSLQLSNIYVREVNYNWKLYSKFTEVNISLAKVSFDWNYKKDQGMGTFEEESLKYDFNQTFAMTSANRFIINVPSNKVTVGKMKVHLGGKAQQTVIVQITNLILNHASFLFRNIIGNKIAQAIQSFSKIIGNDIQIGCFNGKCLQINTTLVATPIVSNQTLILQVNAAPYIKGESNSPLNPPQALFKQNSSKIEVQIHKKFIEVLIQKYLKINEIDLTIKTMGITSVVSINSKSLASVFPPMAKFSSIRDVVFQVKVAKVNITFLKDSFEVQTNASIVVSTQDLKTHERFLYLNPVEGSIKIDLSPIFGKISSSVRVNKLNMFDIYFNPSDVSHGLVVPDALLKYLDIFMLWATDAFNFSLNKKSKTFAFNDIQAIVHGKLINPNVYCIDLDLVNKIIIQ